MRARWTYLCLLMGLLLVGTARAQQLPLSNFYQFNPFLVNPGYAGFNNALEGTMAHRLQWRGIEGAPTTSFLGLHGAVGRHIGLGGKITIDETDILQRITGGASMAYRLKLGADQQLAVGLTAAFTQNRIQFEDVIVGDAMDDLLFNSNQNGTTVDLEFGLTYQWKRLQVGLAGMQLLESGVNHDRQDGEGTLELRRHWVGFARYEFPINASWFFQPSAMIRAQEDGDAQVDLNGQVSWRHRLYVGGGYRQDAGVIALASVRMADRIMVGYAFEFSGSGIANNSNGSHEFMLGYGLRKWKKPPPKPKEPEVSAVVKSDTSVLDSNGRAVRVAPSRSPDTTQTGFQIRIEGQSEQDRPVEAPQEGAESVLQSVRVERVKPLNVSDEKPVEAPLPPEEQPDVQSEPIAVTVPKPPPVSKPEKPSESVSLIAPVETAPRTPLALSAAEQAVFDQRIEFNLGESEPRAAARKVLNSMARVMRQHPEMEVEVIGHACDLGGGAFNAVIAEKRAYAIKDYLIDKGIAARRIKASGRSDSEPVAPNDTETNRQRNRRVEFQVR